jgi:hypothetical protein
VSVNHSRLISAMVDESEAIITDPVRSTELDAARKRAPVDYMDQLNAAERESARYVRDALASGDLLNERVLSAADNPPWVRRPMFEAMITWVIGLGKVCVHNPSSRRPQPVYAAMWRPGVVVCAHCTPLLSMPGRGLSVQDRTCPGCKRITGGPDSDELHLHGVQSSVMTFAFTVCTACRYWDADG